MSSWGREPEPPNPAFTGGLPEGVGDVRPLERGGLLPSFFCIAVICLRRRSAPFGSWPGSIASYWRRRSSSASFDGAASAALGARGVGGRTARGGPAKAFTFG